MGYLTGAKTSEPQRLDAPVCLGIRRSTGIHCLLAVTSGAFARHPQACQMMEGSARTATGGNRWTQGFEADPTGTAPRTRCEGGCLTARQQRRSWGPDLLDR